MNEEPQGWEPLAPPTGPATKQPNRPPTWAIVVGSLVAIAVVGTAVRSLGSSGGDKGRDTAVDFTFSDGVCNDLGWSGVFRFANGKPFTGELWAVALRDGKVIDRDVEYIRGLRAGAPENVEFVWNADGVTSCRMESVKRR